MPPVGMANAASVEFTNAEALGVPMKPCFGLPLLCYAIAALAEQCVRVDH